MNKEGDKSGTGPIMVTTDIIINDIEYEFTIKAKNLVKFKTGIIFISIFSTNFRIFNGFYFKHR
jgi:hypothetical protein